MRARRLLWPVGLLSILLLTQTALADDYSYVRIVRLSLVEGDVQLQRPDVEGWVPAVANTPLQQGFRIYSGHGRTEIEFESGAVARLAPDTLAELTELILLSSGGRSTQITLEQGTATFYANLSRQDSFLVLTPSMQVTVPEQARFRVNVGPQATTVNVYKGEVGVSAAGGTNRLSKGQMLQVLNDDPAHSYLARLPERDDWDRWNDERDDIVSSARTSDYVPAEVRYGVSDLDRYGSWLYLSDLGNCWQPYVSFGWVPFSVGRWVWFPKLGYTWVSYEPWGWLPYHYGHWTFAASYGWVWVPGGFNRFAAGPVDWLEGRGWIGWHPRGPGNRSRGTVVTTPGGFTSGQPPTPIEKRPDIDRDARPIDRPSIPPDVRAHKPLFPDETGETPPPGPGEGEGTTGGTGTPGTVVTVAPRTEPTTPARPGGDTVRPPRRPPGAGRIKYDPEEGRYVNLQPVAPEAPLPIYEPRTSPSQPNKMKSPKFESSEPRGSSMDAPRERVAPPPAPHKMIEHRPPSISPPPRTEPPAQTMSAPPAPRERAPSPRPSKTKE